MLLCTAWMYSNCITWDGNVGTMCFINYCRLLPNLGTPLRFSKVLMESERVRENP